MNRLLSLVVALVLTGCASPHSDLLAKDKPLLSATSGLVLASFGTMASVHIHFRPVGDPGGQEYVMTTDGHFMASGGWRDREVVRSSNDEGRLLVGYSVKPGKYQVTKARVSINMGTMYSAEINPPPRQEFEVFANGVSYVGSYQFKVRTGTTVLGTPAPSTARLFVQDEMSADHELLLRVRPELKSSRIIDFSAPQ